jgi:hypothetical protein
MDRQREEQERRETPIIDGDARPDIPVDSDEIREKQRERRNKNFESERKSDINSLEDHKDAK